MILMNPLFILGVLLGGLAVVFDLQNVTTTTVSFYSWHIESSLALVLAMAVLTGIAIALLITLPNLISNYFQYNKLKKENEKLREELRQQKELTFFAKKTSPTEGDITDIEKGAISESHSSR